MYRRSSLLWVGLVTTVLGATQGACGGAEFGPSVELPDGSEPPDTHGASGGAAGGGGGGTGGQGGGQEDDANTGGAPNDGQAGNAGDDGRPTDAGMASDKA